jgi:hypothetical protein
VPNDIPDWTVLDYSGGGLIDGPFTVTAGNFVNHPNLPVPVGTVAIMILGVKSGGANGGEALVFGTTSGQGYTKSAGGMPEFFAIGSVVDTAVTISYNADPTQDTTFYTIARVDPSAVTVINAVSLKGFTNNVVANVDLMGNLNVVEPPFDWHQSGLFNNTTATLSAPANALKAAQLGTYTIRVANNAATAYASDLQFIDGAAVEIWRDGVLIPAVINSQDRSNQSGLRLRASIVNSALTMKLLTVVPAGVFVDMSMAGWYIA